MNTEDDFADWKLKECDAFLKTTNWRSTAMENGKLYYYDKVTKKSQWKKPEELVEFENTLTLEKFRTNISNETEDSMMTVKSESLSDKKDDVKLQDTIKQQEKPLQEELTKEELEAILDSKDSILEPNIISIAKKLLQKDTSPATVVEKLSNSYTGYPLMIKIILDCIKLGKILEITQNQQNTSKLHSNFVNTTAHAKIETIASKTYNDELLVPILSDLISNRFNRKTADSLVSNTNTNNTTNNQNLPVIPVYVHNLIKDNKFKEILLDLYQINEHSILLKACCTGAYLVDTEDGLISSEIAVSKENNDVQCSKADAVLFDLVGFYLIKEYMKAPQQQQSAWGSSPEVLSRLQLLVSESSETVKFYLLQQLQQCWSQSTISTTAVTADIGTTTTTGTTATATMLGKRSRGDCPAASQQETDRTTNNNDGDSSGEDSDEDVWGAAKRSRLSVVECAAEEKRENKVESSEAAIPRTVSMVNAAETLASLCEPSGDAHSSEHTVEKSEVYRAILSVDSTTPISTTTGGDSELQQGHKAEVHSRLQVYPVWKVLSGALEKNALTMAEITELSTLTKLQECDECDLFLAHPTIQLLLFTYCLHEDAANTTTSSSSSSSNATTATAAVEMLGVYDGLLRTGNLLVTTHALCREIQETFYGVVSLISCEQLHRIIETNVISATFVTAWVRACATNTTSRDNFFYGQTLKLLTTFMSTIVAHHPLLFSEVLEIIKLLWASSTLVSAMASRELDPARASALTLSLAELQRELVDLAVQLVAAGSAVAPMLFLTLTLDSCDIDLVRHVLHSLLQLDSSTVWTSPAASAALIDLLHTDRAQEAVHSAHFLHEDRRLLLSTIQIIPTTLLTLSTQQKLADLQHIYVIS